MLLKTVSKVVYRKLLKRNENVSMKTFRNAYFVKVFEMPILLIPAIYIFVIVMFLASVALILSPFIVTILNSTLLTYLLCLFDLQNRNTIF